MTEEENRAAKVRHYWQARGYDVDARVGYTASKTGDSGYALRSDLVNGLPRNIRTEWPVDVAVPVRR